jgi:hypothetical protein
MSKKIENYSEMLEVDTLTSNFIYFKLLDIIKALNSKVKKIKNKIYFLLKIHLLDPDNKKYDKEEQVRETYLSLQGYMKDIHYDEEKEKIVFKEIMEFEEKSVKCSVSEEEWNLIELIKKD